MPIAINGSGTVTGLSAGGISDTKAVTDAAMPAGAIIQVVQSTVSDSEQIFDSNSYAAGNLSCTITPTRASSKILIQSTQVLDTKASGRQLYLAIFRSIAGGTYTNISGGSESGNVAAYSSNARLIETALIIKLDSPSYSVGQSITYKIYGKANGSHQTATGGQDTEQLMVLQEVAA